MLNWRRPFAEMAMKLLERPDRGAGQRHDDINARGVPAQGKRMTAQQCYICGPTEERRRCQPNKLMDVPSNITIDDSMCTVIENTAYHLDELCQEYPAPQGYYFECVDKSNSQFSCRSTCGPSLESIGTGPEFDLLNSGGGNLLLGKKNKESLFDFSNFKNGGALDFKFGGVQKGIYNPNNLPGSNNTNFAKDQNINGTYGTSSGNSQSRAGGFASNTGSDNIFDKNLFGTSGINNNVFTNNNIRNNANDYNNNNNNYNNANLNGGANNALNNNNQNVFEFKNPFSNTNNNLNPNQPNSFGGNNRKPTPKLNTPKGNPFGNAPAFGQAPFGPNAFGNPSPLSGGKTGLGFIEPKQDSVVNLKFDGSRQKKPGKERGNRNNDLAREINLAELGTSEAIDLSKGTPPVKNPDPNTSEGNPNLKNSPSEGGNRFPLQDPTLTKAKTSTRNENVGNVGRQDPSALTFDVKPIVTNYPTNQDDEFDPEQANSLYPLNDNTYSPRGSYGDRNKENVQDQSGQQSYPKAKLDSVVDDGSNIENRRNVPSSYPVAYDSVKRPQGNNDNYQNYGGNLKQPLDSNQEDPQQYGSTARAPRRQGSQVNTGQSAYTDNPSHQAQNTPPGVGDYPGYKNSIDPSSGYSADTGRGTNQQNYIRYNNKENHNQYSNDNGNNNNNVGNVNDNYYDINKNAEDSRKNAYGNEAYPGSEFPNSNRYGKQPRSQLNRDGNEDDDLRSNEVRDAIGPEGLKTKGVVAPDGLDGSRLRRKEPVGQGADFVGTSLLADGDYLDRSSPGR
ncbi:hypothetical protein PoB_003547700 [Plakobranchus ocellatus]|uniref:Uncharacterized protein n=1 Tax=Plakobranchus ocellatus TaxID=259542 RepID=A0AAV4APW3_9GAST|nr:hypothetical protein PoB_003547700 [Plakobranchus ocellatus]